jgi:hypothetical protein
MSYYDPRYSLPALVFLAVLGTGWIASLARPARTATTGLLAVLFVLNTVMISTGVGREIAVDVPATGERLVLISGAGYVERDPEESLGFRELLAGAREQGAQTVLFEGSSLNTGGTNLNGLAALAYAEGLGVLPEFEAQAMGPRDIFMIRRTLGEAAGIPCIRLPSRQAVYVYRGGAPTPTTATAPESPTAPPPPAAPSG